MFFAHKQNFLHNFETCTLRNQKKGMGTAISVTHFRFRCFEKVCNRSYWTIITVEFRYRFALKQLTRWNVDLYSVSKDKSAYVLFRMTKEKRHKRRESPEREPKVKIKQEKLSPVRPRTSRRSRSRSNSSSSPRRRSRYSRNVAFYFFRSRLYWCVFILAGVTTASANASHYKLGEACCFSAKPSARFSYYLLELKRRRNEFYLARNVI